MDLTPIIMEIVSPVAAALITALIWRIGQRFGLEIDRRVLLDAIEAKAGELVAKHGGALSITARSEAVNDLASYVIARTPDAMRRLGLDRIALQEIILTRLGAAQIPPKRSTPASART